MVRRQPCAKQLNNHANEDIMRLGRSARSPGCRFDLGVSMKSQGEIEAATCEGLRRFEQEYMGRGPKDIHTHLIGDLLVVRLQGVLTAAEQHLVKSLTAARSIFQPTFTRPDAVVPAPPMTPTPTAGVGPAPSRPTRDSGSPTAGATARSPAYCRQSPPTAWPSAQCSCDLHPAADPVDISAAHRR